MKVLTFPQSGKIGVEVAQGGRYGQIRRALVIPTNKNSAGQRAQRAIFGTQSARWNTLTEEQRLAWNAAATTQQSMPRLGQSGMLTGLQLFTKLNTVLGTFGGTPVDEPTRVPTFPALATTALVITNESDVIAIKLTCPSDPGSQTIVRASGPVTPGTYAKPVTVILGTCPAPVAGAATITGIYEARYGTPPVGSKIFVEVNQFVDGWEDNPVTFSAIVPAS